MGFRLEVTHREIEDDENVYHAILFVNPDIVINKRLEFSKISNKLQAHFDFAERPLTEDQNLLVMLVIVSEGENIEGVHYKLVKAASENIQVIDF